MEGRIGASSAGLRVRLESASLLFYEHSLCMHGPELALGLLAPYAGRQPQR